MANAFEHLFLCLTHKEILKKVWASVKKSQGQSSCILPGVRVGEGTGTGTWRQGCADGP